MTKPYFARLRDYEREKKELFNGAATMTTAEIAKKLKQLAKKHKI